MRRTLPSEAPTTAAPESAELGDLVLRAPPMPGAEYLTNDALAEVWHALDDWVRAEGAACEVGLAAFLKLRAPLWHQVGCVYLASAWKHLANYATHQ